MAALPWGFIGVGDGVVNVVNGVANIPGGLIVNPGADRPEVLNTDFPKLKVGSTDGTDCIQTLSSDYVFGKTVSQSVQYDPVTSTTAQMSLTTDSAGSEWRYQRYISESAGGAKLGDAIGDTNLYMDGAYIYANGPIQINLGTQGTPAVSSITVTASAQDGDCLLDLIAPSTSEIALRMATYDAGENVVNRMNLALVNGGLLFNNELTGQIGNPSFILGETNMYFGYADSTGTGVSQANINMARSTIVMNGVSSINNAPPPVDLLQRLFQANPSLSTISFA